MRKAKPPDTPEARLSGVAHYGAGSWAVDDRNRPWFLRRVSIEDSPVRIALGAWFRHRPVAIRFVALLTLVIGVLYFVARAGSGIDVHPVYFAALYTAELLGFIAFAILVAELWSEPRVRRPAPLDVLVDVIVTIDTDDVDVVEPAIVGALSLRGRTLLHIVGEGQRPAVRALAEQYGVEYRTSEPGRAAAVNAVLPDLEGDLVLLLDARHVAAPDLLEAVSGYFTDPGTVLVHSGRAVRIGDVETDDSVVPPFATTETALWDGSAALIRRTALLEIGGMASSTSTPHLETALLLQRVGGHVRYHHEALVQGAGVDRPENSSAGVLRRVTSARGGWPQRIADFGTLIAALGPLQHLVLFAALVLVALPGIEPLTQPGALIAVLWVMWAALSWVGAIALGRGSRGVHRGLIDLTPAMIATGVPLTMYGMVIAVILVRVGDSVSTFLGGPSFLPPIDATTLIVLGIIGVAAIYVMLRYVGLLERGPRQRRLWRFAVDLRGSVDGVAARCIDLHQSGASFLLPRGELAIGDRVAIEIECRTVDDVASTARGELRITSVQAASSSGSTVRIGGPVEWDTPASRRIVIEYCYVAQPYTVRTGNERHARLPVELHARVGGLTARCIDMSTEGAAFIVSESVWKVGETVVAEVQLVDGTLAQGFLQVRTIVPQENGRVRLGGLASWNETSWLERYATIKRDGDTPAAS